MRAGEYVCVCHSHLPAGRWWAMSYMREEGSKKVLQTHVA